MSEQESRTPSGARHLAMVACILIGVFAYVGWRLKNNEKPTTADSQQQAVEDALTASAAAHDLQTITHSNTPAEPTTAATPEVITQELATPAAPNYGDLSNLIPESRDPDVTRTPTSPAADNSSSLPLPDFDSSSIGDRTPTAPKTRTTRLIENAITPAEPLAPHTATPHNAESRTSHTESSVIMHTVQPKETLSMLAERYLGTRARAVEIFNANRDLLPSPDMLAVGMRLRIPDGVNSAASLTHTITGSDTLPSLAIRYYGSASPEIISLLREANPALRAGGFTPGTTLVIPPHKNSGNTETTSGQHRTTNTPLSLSKKYTVKSGDTLSKIASEIYNDKTRWREIYNNNRDKLPSPNRLTVGMKLQIP